MHANLLDTGNIAFMNQENLLETHLFIKNNCLVIISWTRGSPVDLAFQFVSNLHPDQLIYPISASLYLPGTNSMNSLSVSNPVFLLNVQQAPSITILNFSQPVSVHLELKYSTIPLIEGFFGFGCLGIVIICLIIKINLIRNSTKKLKKE
jgi:hypothetical protein